MIQDHDQWSKMGEEHLGEHNIRWAQMMEGFPVGAVGIGPLTLMKAIMNDYWADCTIPEDGWSREHVNVVMSKLYWCWVAWLEATHLEVSEEE